MKSTSGAHFVGLDHVRALAAFMVITWHFMHWSGDGYPVPFDGAPLLPFALFDEGHTGVALFMTLSGYLFAKLISDRQIIYSAFLWNRALRLLPLLAFVVCVVGAIKYAQGADMWAYAKSIIGSAVYPWLPNGGWSITAEAHFYILLPLLLVVVRRSRLAILGLVLAAIALRTFLWLKLGQVQLLAYPTIVGRFDQFALGILFFHVRHLVTGRHLVAGLVGAAFVTFYWIFDRMGGGHSIGYEAPIWIVLATIEGAAYATLIAWYDSSFAPGQSAASRVWGRFGELSYSIYLLHFFFVHDAALFVHRHIMDISNFYLALAWAAVFFALMYIPAALSFRFIEAPALRLRRPYVRAIGPSNLPDMSATRNLSPASSGSASTNRATRSPSS